MANLEKLKEMHGHFYSNLPRYIKEHPGEFIVYDGSCANISFYAKKEEAQKILAKYENIAGHTFLIEEIPKKPLKSKSLEDKSNEPEIVLMDDEFVDLIRGLNGFQEMSNYDD